MLTRLQYPLVAGLLLVFLALGWSSRVPAMRASGDDEFKYLALSKSLEAGSYRESYRPTAPLHVQYPPVYPAWLLLLRNVAGENHDVIRAANLALVALVLLGWYAVARRLAGVGLALGLLGLLALNRGLLIAGGSLGSEGLFLFLGSIALAWTVLPPRSERLAVAGVIGFALLAFLTRSIGLSVVLAAGTWLLFRRKRGPLLGWAVASSLVVGGWVAYTVLARQDNSVRSYASSFVAMTDRPEGALSLLATRIWRHGVTYVTSEIPYTLSVPTLGGTLIDNWAWLVVSLVLSTVGVGLLWRHWRAAAVYGVLSVALILVWPFQDGRLFIPLVPLGLLALLLGGRWLTGFLPVRARTAALGTLVVLLGVGALRGALDVRARFGACDHTNPYHSPACYDAPRLALSAAGEYVRRNLAPGETVVAREPASFNYLSGHPAESAALIQTPPRSSVLERLRARNARYIFVSLPWMARVLQPTCPGLRVEAKFPPHAFLVSIATAPDSASNACSEIIELARRPPPTAP